MKKPQNNYAFIDGQNLNLSIQRLGWKLDFRKLRVFLSERNNLVYFRVQKIPQAIKD